MRSEGGCLFLSGGSGVGTVFVSSLGMIPSTPAHVRARSFCARCAVPQDWPVSGLFGGSVTSLCHGDWWWACRVGGAVPWGLLGRALRGWR